MSKFVLVEAISQFRQRYIIEVPDDHNEKEFPCTAEQWAEDTVTMEETKEFSQYHLGEVITSSREVSKKEINKLFYQDNYASSWDKELIFKNCVTEIGYRRD
jgi:hypothetical protein